MLNEQKNLLQQIRAYDFAVIDAGLYLDAYENQESLQYFHHISQKSALLKSEYEDHYAPLTTVGVTSENSWTWVQTPWPWEMEAN
jgi:spore coat protein JB